MKYMKLNARNTAEILQIFRDENKFDKTLRKIKEFMEPKAFGSSLGENRFFCICVCTKLGGDKVRM